MAKRRLSYRLFSPIGFHNDCVKRWENHPHRSLIALHDGSKIVFCLPFLYRLTKFREICEVNADNPVIKYCRFRVVAVFIGGRFLATCTLYICSMILARFIRRNNIFQYVYHG